MWTGEAYTVDAVSTMCCLAAVTKRAMIGSSILPLYTRTPTLLAMTAIGLNKLSAGRFILGLGASRPQVVEGFPGVPCDNPLTRTRELRSATGWCVPAFAEPDYRSRGVRHR